MALRGRRINNFVELLCLVWLVRINVHQSLLNTHLSYIDVPNLLGERFYHKSNT